MPDAVTLWSHEEPNSPVGTEDNPIFVTGDIEVGDAVAATATLSNVSSSASNVTLLAANAARKGATIFNDSSAILYVKFGTTASTSSYTVQMAAGGYFEVPFGYTGRIDGIWASANGNARVTELT